MNARTKRIDTALAEMAAAREPGRCYSVGEIAEVCGCHPHAIEVIEKRALAKLRLRLKDAGLDSGELPSD